MLRSDCTPNDDVGRARRRLALTLEAYYDRPQTATRRDVREAIAAYEQARRRAVVATVPRRLWRLPLVGAKRLAGVYREAVG